MRVGLLKTVQFPDELPNRFQANVKDAIEQLASDHDLLTVPVTSLSASGAIQAGKSVVAYVGNTGAVLTLPLAAAQGRSTSAILLIENASTGPITIRTAGTDTIFGKKTATLAALSMLVLASDGVSQWFAPAGSGRLLRAPQILTAGTTITHPPGTATIVVRGVGGGGGGGGNNGGGVTAGSIGGCGGSGTYGERAFTVVASTSTYVCGAAGTNASGAAGGNGGNSTFTHNGTTVTLPGGNGGAMTAGGATVATAAGGAGGGAATNADISVPGQAGGTALRPAAAATPAIHSGAGGSNPLGEGGAGIATAGGAVAAVAATGLGAGGSGALAGTGTASAPGGAARPGGWIVSEYS